MAPPVCDFCGCRQQPAIDTLSEEHERLLDLGYRLRSSATDGDRERVRATVARDLLPLLHHHTDKEERGLFTQLRAAWEADDRLAALVVEHREIDRLASRVLDDDVGWREHLATLVATLSEHILSEETDLFPYALYELDHRQWDEVERVHASTAGRPAASV
jgi:hemerythrin-like domain-containing protein